MHKEFQTSVSISYELIDKILYLGRAEDVLFF